MIDKINENSSSIRDTLTEQADKVGYTMTDSLNNIWANDGNANAIITKYGENFCGQLTSVNNVLNSITEQLGTIIKASDTEAKDNIKEETKTPSATTPTTSETPKTETPKTESSNSSNATTTKTIKVGGKINAGGAKIYDYVGDKSGETQYYKKDPIYTVLEEKNGYIKVRHHSLSKGVTGWFKKSDVKAYKTGGLVDETGLAWLDGTKKKPEMVLNSQDTENFIELTDVLRNLDVSSMMSNMVPMFNALNTNIPSLISGNSNQNMNNVFNMTFELHDVTNGEQVINYLIKSDRFENAVKAMTVDRLAGGSKFSKSKYIKN